MQEFDTFYPKDQAGLLVKRGISEMIHLARRIRAMFGQYFPSEFSNDIFTFEHTWKERTT